MPWSLQQACLKRVPHWKDGQASQAEQKEEKEADVPVSEEEMGECELALAAGLLSLRAGAFFTFMLDSLI